MPTAGATGTRGPFATAAAPQSRSRLTRRRSSSPQVGPGRETSMRPAVTFANELTESRMMLRNVLLKRMQNWVRQLAEKL